MKQPEVDPLAEQLQNMESGQHCEDYINVIAMVAKEIYERKEKAN